MSSQSTAGLYQVPDHSSADRPSDELGTLEPVSSSPAPPPRNPARHSSLRLNQRWPAMAPQNLAAPEFFDRQPTPDIPVRNPMRLSLQAPLNELTHSEQFDEVIHRLGDPSETSRSHSDSSSLPSLLQETQRTSPSVEDIAVDTTARGSPVSFSFSPSHSRPGSISNSYQITADPGTANPLFETPVYTQSHQTPTTAEALQFYGYSLDDNSDRTPVARVRKSETELGSEVILADNDAKSLAVYNGPSGYQTSPSRVQGLDPVAESAYTASCSGSLHTSPSESSNGRNRHNGSPVRPFRRIRSYHRNVSMPKRERSPERRTFSDTRLSPRPSTSARQTPPVYTAQGRIRGSPIDTASDYGVFTPSRSPIGRGHAYQKWDLPPANSYTAAAPNPFYDDSPAPSVRPGYELQFNVPPPVGPQARAHRSILVEQARNDASSSSGPRRSVLRPSVKSTMPLVSTKARAAFSLDFNNNSTGVRPLPALPRRQSSQAPLASIRVSAGSRASSKGTDNDLRESAAPKPLAPVRTTARSQSRQEPQAPRLSSLRRTDSGPSNFPVEQWQAPASSPIRRSSPEHALPRRQPSTPPFDLPSINLIPPTTVSTTPGTTWSTPGSSSNSLANDSSPKYLAPREAPVPPSRRSRTSTKVSGRSTVSRKSATAVSSSSALVARSEYAATVIVRPHSFASQTISAVPQIQSRVTNPRQSRVTKPRRRLTEARPVPLQAPHSRSKLGLLISMVSRLSATLGHTTDVKELIRPVPKPDKGKAPSKSVRNLSISRPLTEEQEIERLARSTAHIGSPVRPHTPVSGLAPGSGNEPASPRHWVTLYNGDSAPPLIVEQSVVLEIERSWSFPANLLLSSQNSSPVRESVPEPSARAHTSQPGTDIEEQSSSLNDTAGLNPLPGNYSSSAHGEANPPLRDQGPQASTEPNHNPPEASNIAVEESGRDDLPSKFMEDTSAVEEIAGPSNSSGGPSTALVSTTLSDISELTEESNLDHGLVADGIGNLLLTIDRPRTLSLMEIREGGNVEEFTYAQYFGDCDEPDTPYSKTKVQNFRDRIVLAKAICEAENRPKPPEKEIPQENTAKKELKPEVSLAPPKRSSQYLRLSHHTISSILSFAHNFDESTKASDTRRKAAEKAKAKDRSYVASINSIKDKKKTPKYSPALLNRQLRLLATNEALKQCLEEDDLISSRKSQKSGRSSSASTTSTIKAGANQSKTSLISKSSRLSSAKSGTGEKPDYSDPTVNTSHPRPQPKASSLKNKVNTEVSHFSDDSSIQGIGESSRGRFYQLNLSLISLRSRPSVDSLASTKTIKASRKTSSSANMPLEHDKPDSKPGFFSKTFHRNGKDKENDKGKEVEEDPIPTAPFNLTPLSSLIKQSYKDIHTLRDVHGRIVDTSDGTMKRIDFDKIENSLKVFEELYQAFLRYGSAEDGGPAEEVHLIAMICKRSDVEKNASTMQPDDSVPVVAGPPSKEQGRGDRRKK